MALKPLNDDASDRYLRRVLSVAELYELPGIVRARAAFFEWAYRGTLTPTGGRGRVQLVRYFRDYAAGNPKHIEELAAQLLRMQAISVDDGRVRILADDLMGVPLPQKMLGYIRSTIDRFQVGWGRGGVGMASPRFRVSLVSLCMCWLKATGAAGTPSAHGEDCLHVRVFYREHIKGLAVASWAISLRAGFSGAPFLCLRLCS